MSYLPYPSGLFRGGGGGGGGGGRGGVAFLLK